MLRLLRLVAALGCVLATCLEANGSIPVSEPDANGFRWATIGDVNNPAYNGPAFSEILPGRGSVGYSYRMAQMEVNSGQWVEFEHAMATTPGIPTAWLNQLGAVRSGASWGANPVWREMPYAGTSWRAAAMYCNWLHNGKARTVAAFANGAYDVSTFGYSIGPFGTQILTDQPVHNPGARYWIPTLDEWIKAAYYDPTKATDQGTGGWWKYPNMTDDHQPVPGFPGDIPPHPAVGPMNGETSVGLVFGNGGDDFVWQIPLGAYPMTRTYYGLLDVSGGASEWLEEVLYPQDPYTRAIGGKSANSGRGPLTDSIAASMSGGFYEFDDRAGLRLASLIPTPSAVTLVFACATSWISRRRSR